MFTENYAEVNREAWNEVTPIHQESRKAICGIDLEKEVLEENFCCLEDEELKMFNMVEFKGKKVAQLCCNNGREIISLRNIGIKEGIGFDISDEALKEARYYNDLAKSDCKFVRCNVYDIDVSTYNQFDIVYMSIGGMIWLHDAGKLFNIISKMLKPSGHFIIYDMHPFTVMLGLEGEDGYDASDPNKVVYSYFKKDPWIDSSGLDYYGGKEYDAKENYSFPRKMSDILMAVISAQMSIEYFNEFTEDISGEFEEVEKCGKMPLSYSLIAKKK